MFGYVKPQKLELKVKEYELYNSIYCGLCRVMGKRYSYIYKMSLSYDFVFMVLLRLYAAPEKVSFSQKRCIAHPAKKKTMMDENSALDISSDVGVIMLYHNMLDKIKDKDGVKSFLGIFLLPEMKRLRKKAVQNQKLKTFDIFAEEVLNNLSRMEKENCPSVDQTAEEFGRLLGEAVSIDLDGTKKNILYELGRNMGKWIYIADALDDIESDCKKKKYNPLIASYGSAEEAKKHFETVNTSLLLTLAEADKALELLEETDCGIHNILSNIIRLGTVGIQKNILEKNNFKEI